MVQSVKSVVEFNQLVNKPKAVLKFSATWCGPCKAIAPVVEKMAPSYPDISFGDIDVDVHSDIAKMYNVTSMPTVVFVSNGKETARTVGADISSINANLRDLKNHGGAFSGEGKRLGGSPSSPSFASPSSFSSTSSATRISPEEARQLRLRRSEKQAIAAAAAAKEAAKADLTAELQGSSLTATKTNSSVTSQETNTSTTTTTTALGPRGWIENVFRWIYFYLMTLFSFDSRATADRIQAST